MNGSLLGDRYRLGQLLGRGGMGSVYRADDEMLGRVVAVKVLSEDPKSGGSADRKRSEMRVLASLNHPGLITVFDADIDAEPSAYLVMEFVDGPTLHERLLSGPLAPSEVASMAKGLGEALAVVHASGVIHRDIKPSNVLLSTRRVGGAVHAKLADFGIATLVDATRLTVPGTLIGTAAYLAPEQLGSAAPAPSADIYSLGLVLLECVTGSRAFPGTPAESVSARLVSDPVIPQSVPVALRALFVAMTAREPADRPSASDVVEMAERAERDLLSEPNSDALATMPSSLDNVGEQKTLLLPAPTEVITPAPEPQVNKPRVGLRTKVLVGAGFLLTALAIGLALNLPAAPPPEPQLPTTDAPLSEHLETLLESVSP